MIFLFLLIFNFFFNNLFLFSGAGKSTVRLGSSYVNSRFCCLLYTPDSFFLLGDIIILAYFYSIFLMSIGMVKFN